MVVAALEVVESGGDPVGVIAQTNLGDDFDESGVQAIQDKAKAAAAPKPAAAEIIPPAKPAIPPTREYVTDRAELLGAVRLPVTAFAKTAKTEVITDLIVLRALQQGEVASNPDQFVETVPLTVDGPKGERTFTRSAYFDAHPDMILGTERASGTMRGAGGNYNVEGAFTLNDLQDRLERILPANGYTRHQGPAAADPANRGPAARATVRVPGRQRHAAPGRSRRHPAAVHTHQAGQGRDAAGSFHDRPHQGARVGAHGATGDHGRHARRRRDRRGGRRRAGQAEDRLRSVLQAVQAFLRLAHPQGGERCYWRDE